MKINLSICCISLIISFFLFSCKNEKVQILDSSPDKKIKITILGEKSSTVDPFMVNIKTEGYGYNETISTEIYASTLDSNNVKFNWRNNKECYFIFLQQDNTVRRMHLKIDDEQIMLNEEGSNSELP